MSDEMQTCPRCGGALRQFPEDAGAYSREGQAVGADITVCGPCGAAEAGIGLPRPLLASWALLLTARTGEVGTGSPNLPSSG